MRAARERPASPIVNLTPVLSTARRLAVVWGVHSVQIAGVHDVDEMTMVACDIARREGFAAGGQIIVVLAGMPFGRAETTNLLRVAKT